MVGTRYCPKSVQSLSTDYGIIHIRTIYHHEVHINQSRIRCHAEYDFQSNYSQWDDFIPRETQKRVLYWLQGFIWEV